MYEKLENTPNLVGVDGRHPEIGGLENIEGINAPGTGNVYGLRSGEIFFIPEGDERPVPQMVENAEHTATTCAKNLHAQITGGSMEKYDPKFHGIMVSVGGRYAVARGGLANHQMNLPSFIAMLAKHFINIVYFLQVMGWTKIFHYCKQEFFTIRNRRTENTSFKRYRS